MGAECDIKFENCQSNIVHSGQEVAGTVDINVHDNMKVQKVTLFIEGFGECEWFEDEMSYGNNYHKVPYRARDQYVNTVTYLIPNETVLQKGHHTYNFMFQVFEGAPTTVFVKHGKISYRARVVFNRPWKTDLEFKKDFVVIRKFDLNLDSRFRNCMQEEKIMRFGYLFFKSDPVTYTVFIPQNGFVVGQPIIIKVVIDNPSTVQINHMITMLKKYIQYRSQTPKPKRKYEDAVVHRMIHGNCDFKDKREFYLKFTIPNTVPTTNNLTDEVIKIHYELNVIAQTSGIHQNAEVSFPITIGTVPIVAQNISNNSITDQTSTVVCDDFSNSMMPRISSPTAPPRTMSPRDSPTAPPRHNMMPPRFSPTASPRHNMMPPRFSPIASASPHNYIIKPSAPFDPDELPPSFEEATKMCNYPLYTPTVNAEPSTFYNVERPVGFNDNKLN